MAPTSVRRSPFLLAVTCLLSMVSSSSTSYDTTKCDRSCLADIVNQIICSFKTHDPYSLPLAITYKATENSHPAALGMMTAWHTITHASTPPTMLALDTVNGTAAFALSVVEGNPETPSVLRGRIKVVHRKITELELFINRYRGDHGFSFNATELTTNYAALMSPPASRVKPTREELYALSADLFGRRSKLNVTISKTCQFTELGWTVVDAGTWGNDTTRGPVGCSMPSLHPYDDHARVALVIDEELGFVVTGAVIPGTVYPYQNISAFIPDEMAESQEMQAQFLKERVALGQSPNIVPLKAAGDMLEVVQYYDGALQALQINLYLNGPHMTSAWL